MIFNLILTGLILSCLKRSNMLACGLIGFSGTDNFAFDVNAIKLLMFWNSKLRGEDSTGIYSPDNGLVKNTDKAEEFLEKNEIIIDDIFIGHVRSKTIGFITDKNAHPFQSDSIILAHNGTLSNEYELRKEFSIDYNTYDVDSELLCKGLAKRKNADILQYYEGAAAVLFTDTKKPEILYAFRDKNRPLFRGNLPEGMYISSIKESLTAIGCTNVKEFKEDYLYTITNGAVKSQIKIPRKPIKGSYSNNYNWPSYRDMGVMYPSDDNDENNAGSNDYRWGTNNEDLIGHNILCKSDINLLFGKPCRFIRGNWYRCVEASNALVNSVDVLDEDGVKKMVMLSDFDKFSSEILIGKFCYFIKDAHYPSNKNKISIAKGTILKVLRYDPLKRLYECENDNEVTLVPPYLIRPASIEDIANLTNGYKNNKMLPAKKEEEYNFTLDANGVNDMFWEINGQLENIEKVLNTKEIDPSYESYRNAIEEANRLHKLLADYLCKQYVDFFNESAVEQNASAT